MAKKQHANLLDPQELGSAQACRTGSTNDSIISRRAANAGAASAALDPATGLSRREKCRRHINIGWSDSCRKNRRYRVDSVALSFPIPSDELSDTIEAPQRHLVAELAAADQEWAVDEAGGADPNAAPLARRPTSFWQLQAATMAEHREQLLAELGNDTTFRPVSLGIGARNAFLSTYIASDVPLPTAAYHGTRAANIPSITRHGLLVPGSRGVTVEHRSAHGVGIYTARLGSPFLSLSFCDSNQILFCAVIDSSIDPSKIGAHTRCKSKFGAGRSRNHRQTSRSVAGSTHKVTIGRLRVHRDGYLRGAASGASLWRRAHRSSTCTCTHGVGQLAACPTNKQVRALCWTHWIGHGR